MKRIALVTDGWKRYVTYSWVDGITQGAKELGLDLCIDHFNTFGNWSYDAKHNRGEYNLYNLPEYEQYDGVVFDGTNINDQAELSYLIQRFKNLDIPVVSIANAVDGFYFVGIDNKKLFKEMIDHLYTVHGCRSFVFAGGPDNNYENLMRFEAFKEAMDQYGITVTPDMCLFGDFDFDTGKNYIEKWLEENRKLPGAFVCANDNIAAGVCYAAIKAGYKVPQDFLVTGFDNLEKAAYYNPQISTVEHNRGNIGRTVVKILKAVWEHEEAPVYSFLDSECIYGESCGCPNSGRVDYRNYIKWQIDYSVDKDRYEESVKQLENRLSECKNFDITFDEYADYIESMDCEGVYIVVDKSLLEHNFASKFGNFGYNYKNMVVAYASEKGRRINGLTSIEQLNRYLRDCQAGTEYMFTSIHFRDEIVGFAVHKNPRFLFENSMFYDVHSVLITKMENLFKQLKIEQANESLKKQYNIDPLTGLYNRTAYNEMILPKFQKYKQKNVTCAMVFFDVDHFKETNDTFGHSFGDEVLKAIARVLKACRPKDGYAYRFGGDEFVVFFPYAGQEKIDKFLKKVEREFEIQYIDVSEGVIVTDPESDTTLDDYLVQADQKMYKVKSARKDKGKSKSDQIKFPILIGESDLKKERYFYKGVDISSLPQHLDGGDKFYRADGSQADPFDLLTENGINSIRIRIWNDPSTVAEAKGYCDLAHTLEMARKIKDHGLHFMLDFHYSDYWADPGQQRKPHAWANLSFEELKKAVYSYTTEVLVALEKEDCLPDIVQIGNEIRSGMLFPEGAVPNYSNLAELINEGIHAVRDVSDEVKVMIHLDQGGRFYYLKEWFDAVFKAGMDKIDAIGISFYSFWHGTYMDLRDSMTQLIERYNVPVYVVETAHPWRHCQGEHVSKELMDTAGLPAGIEEQKKALTIIMQIANEVSGDRDTGVYYWEPLTMPGKDYGSWDENMGMLDEKGQVLKGFESYKYFNPEGQAIPDLDKYINKLYEVDPGKLLPPGQNIIQNGDFANGLKGWWVEKDSDQIQVEEREEEIYVAAKCNFKFSLFKEIRIDKPGKYVLSLDYRGTNTTDVKIDMFIKAICCDQEKNYTKRIFPTDVRFVTHSMDAVWLDRGSVQLGIRMDTPPIFGRIKDIRLIEISE